MTRLRTPFTLLAFPVFSPVFLRHIKLQPDLVCGSTEWLPALLAGEDVEETCGKVARQPTAKLPCATLWKLGAPKVCPEVCSLDHVEGPFEVPSAGACLALLNDTVHGILSVAFAASVDSFPPAGDTFQGFLWVGFVAGVVDTVCTAILTFGHELSPVEETLSFSDTGETWGVRKSF